MRRIERHHMERGGALARTYIMLRSGNDDYFLSLVSAHLAFFHHYFYVCVSSLLQMCSGAYSVVAAHF